MARGDDSSDRHQPGRFRQGGRDRPDECRYDISDTHSGDVQGVFAWGLDEKEWPQPGERSAGLSYRRRWARWPPEPNVGRVAHGVAYRVDRLGALGNGQVPRVVKTAWRLLSGRIVL